MGVDVATPLRVLLVEDSPDDAELLLQELRRGGYEPQSARVQTPEGLRTALADGPWDIVIADYHMPAFSGPRAFVLTREEQVDAPFILVSGVVGEEKAAQAMRVGIDDYLMKDKLTRLPAAVERALRDAEERRQRRKAEEALQRREAILSAVGRTAKQLLMTDDWRTEIHYALERLGEAAQVSRAHLYVIHWDEDGRILASRHAEWVSEVVSGGARNEVFQGVDLEASGYGRWAAILARGETIHGHVRDFPDAERARLESLGVVSIAVVPVHVAGAWWGTIGFQVCQSEREWSQAELEALRIAADTLAAAIQRAEDQVRLQLQVERLDALRTIDHAITGSLDLKVTLAVVLDQVNAQLEVDASTVLLLNPVTQHLDFMAGRGVRQTVFGQVHARVGEGFAGRAALERQSVHIPDLNDVTAPGPFNSLVLREGFRSYHAFPLVAKNEVKGVLEVFNRSPLMVSDEWREFAEMLAGQTAIAVDNAMLLANLTRSNGDLRLAYERTLEGWSRALDLRDNETQGHTERVAELTVHLARAMSMSEEELLHVRRGALLHDIGKMGIPDSILLKPGPLTDEEWTVMRRHPVYAYELLSPIPFLRPALDIPYCHHERWDGTGYPRGLRGEAIPHAARVFSVVDAWDALRSDRPYRKELPVDRVRKMIAEGAGTHFDPRVVEAFLALDITAAG